MKRPVAHSLNSTWFWIELPENCCEPLKFIMKYISIQFCERPGHGRPFHALHKHSISLEICKFIQISSVLLWYGTGQFYPYSSGLLSWHWGNHTIAPVPGKQPWRWWVNKLYGTTEKDNVTTLKAWPNLEHISWNTYYDLSGNNVDRFSHHLFKLQGENRAHYNLISKHKRHH